MPISFWWIKLFPTCQPSFHPLYKPSQIALYLKGEPRGNLKYLKEKWDTLQPGIAAKSTISNTSWTSTNLDLPRLSFCLEISSKQGTHLWKWSWCRYASHKIKVGLLRAIYRGQITQADARGALLAYVQQNQ